MLLQNIELFFNYVHSNGLPMLDQMCRMVANGNPNMVRLTNFDLMTKNYNVLVLITEFLHDYVRSLNMVVTVLGGMFASVPFLAKERFIRLVNKIRHLHDIMRLTGFNLEIRLENLRVRLNSIEFYARPRENYV